MSTKFSWGQIQQSIWSRVDVGDEGECWHWNGRTNQGGYGVAYIWRKACNASRAVWILTKGDPGDLAVCHACDNPPCCNPSHLFLGTTRENSLDSIEKGRWGYRGNKGSKNGQAKLTEEDIVAIRGLLARGETRRAIARRFGLSSDNSINKIANGVAWTHVEKPTASAP